MAWELQTHMHCRVAPSIWAYTADMDEPATSEWLAERYADAYWTPQTLDNLPAYDALLIKAKGMSQTDVVDALVDAAIEEGSTTNGGHRVYLGWNCSSIPWCTEEEMAELGF